MFFKNSYLDQTQENTVEITKYIIMGFSAEDISKKLGVPINLVRGLEKAIKGSVVREEGKFD